MKQYTAILLLVMSAFTRLSAQIIPVKNSFQADLAQVISDYPNRFRHLAGEQLADNPQTIEYSCSVTVKDAVSCRVIKYSSASRDIYSWEAVMMITGEFDEASKKFRSLYNAIQHLSVDINGAKAIFKGEYRQPAEAMKFTSIVFDAPDKYPELKKLKVELLLQAEMLDWKIIVLVYEKEKEDDERGPQTDG
jgi:hypothetical protein